MEASRAMIEPFFLGRPRLGDLLVRKGLLTEAQLGDALVESRSSGELLGRTLIRRGCIFGDELARTLAEQLNLPYIDLEVLGFDRSVARMIPAGEGRRAGAIPVSAVGGRIRVAVADPSDENARAVVERYVPPPFEFAVCDLLAIDQAWRSIEHPVA